MKRELFTTPRGTRDILPGEIEKWQFCEQKIRGVFERYGFKEIRTPIIEHSELLRRGVGEATDIVSKEMYTFEDKGGRSLTIRPEGTAPAARAVLEHNLLEGNNLAKLYYIEPMLRYERPQAGRYRQHTQYGAESVGGDSPQMDIEMLTMLIQLYKELGLKDLMLKINSIGCRDCRPSYRGKLLVYLKQNQNELCGECQKRMKRNPLRTLDCKQDVCRQITKEAPLTLGSLCESCKQHFGAVTRGLERRKINYQIDPTLVRGLDFYTRTTFEVMAGGLAERESTVAGGGRYDDLLETLGGERAGGIGFGAGLERLIMLMGKEPIPFPKKIYSDVFLATMGDQARGAGFDLLLTLREHGIAAEMKYLNPGNLGKQLQFAVDIGAKVVIVLGDVEVEEKSVTVKDLRTREQKKIKESELLDFLVGLSRRGWS